MTAGGTRGAGTSTPCPRRRNRFAFASPGARNFPAAATPLLNLPDGDVDRTNANDHVRLHVALAALGARNLLAEISAESPLNIAANGSAEASSLQAPFAQGSYDVSMRKNSEYTAGINILWHDWHYMAIPGMPLRSDAIDTFDGSLLPDTRTFSRNVVHLGTFAYVRTVRT